jgi:hypothetical protein
MKIKEVAMMAGATALPISVQGLEIPRDQIEIEVQKRGEGVHVIYSRADQKGLAMGNFHARIKAQFPESLSVIFGIQKEEKELGHHKALGRDHSKLVRRSVWPTMECEFKSAREKA